MHPACCSEHFTQISRLFTGPCSLCAALTDLAKFPEGGVLAPCSLCLEQPPDSCGLIPTGLPGFDFIFPSSGRNLSFPSPSLYPAQNYQESCLLLCVTHRLRAPQGKLSLIHGHSQVPSTGPTWNQQPVKLDYTEAGSQISGFPHCFCPAGPYSAPSPTTPFPSRAPLPGHAGHGTGDTAGLGSPKERTHAHGVGAHVLKDQPVPHV